MKRGRGGEDSEERGSAAHTKPPSLPHPTSLEASSFSGLPTGACTQAIDKYTMSSTSVDSKLMNGLNSCILLRCNRMEFF